MLFDVMCKQGKLQLTEDGVLRVQAPFNKTVWQVPVETVQRVVTQPGAMLSVNISFCTKQGTYSAETVTKPNFAKVQAHFQHLEMQCFTDNKWYHDLIAPTHVEVYTDQRKMQKDVEAAAQFGWVSQTSTCQDGRHNPLAMAGGAILLGPIGAILGSGKSKGKIIVTYVRSEEWKAAH